MRFLGIGLAGLIPVALAACSIHIDAGTPVRLGGNAVTGSGKRVSEDRPVPAFHGVEFGGSGSVNVAVGGPQKVTVEIDDNLLSRVTTTVEGGVLHIGTKGRFRSDKGLRVTVQVPSLDSIDMSGSGSARIAGLHGGKLDAALSGSGKIDASGTVERVHLDISGSGEADLSSLKSRDAAVTISGSGSARVDATDSLKADISGSGSVNYTGNPKNVDKSISGSGRVSAGG
jgi:hypothetical protein